MLKASHARRRTTKEKKADEAAEAREKADVAERLARLQELEQQVADMQEQMASQAGAALMFRQWQEQGLIVQGEDGAPVLSQQ